MKKKKTIMIVDDDPDTISSVEGILTKSGFEVIGVDNGREFFETLTNGTIPDLVILDIILPVMSGWDIQRKLKRNSNWEGIPIVFLTARTTEAARDMGKRLGDAYIEKPFEIADLKKTVNDVLKKK